MVNFCGKQVHCDHREGSGREGEGGGEGEGGREREGLGREREGGREREREGGRGREREGGGGRGKGRGEGGREEKGREREREPESGKEEGGHYLDFSSPGDTLLIGSGHSVCDVLLNDRVLHGLGHCSGIAAQVLEDGQG